MNLNQITLPSTDIPRSVEFYLGLGFTQIVDSPHYSRFVCPKGASTFSLHVRDQIAEETGVVIYFESETSDELNRFVQECMDRGYEFSKTPTDERWLWREARLRDPANNEICFYFAGENRLNPPWRVNPESK